MGAILHIVKDKLRDEPEAQNQKQKALKMKINSIQEVADKYNTTLTRAAVEILCAAGVRKRSYPVVIRKQKISPELVEKAEKVLDFASRGVLVSK